MDTIKRKLRHLRNAKSYVKQKNHLSDNEKKNLSDYNWLRKIGYQFKSVNENGYSYSTFNSV